MDTPINGKLAADDNIRVFQLIIKIASRCNLACDYCYMYTFDDTSWTDMPAAMSRETAEVLVYRIAELARHQGFAPLVALHGGEPLLAGYELISFLVRSLKDQMPEIRIAIQSNGTIYSDRLASLLRSTGVELSISLDGFAEDNDRHRFGPTGRSHYRRIRGNLDRARSDGVLESILVVADLAVAPERTYSFICETGTKRANLILRDGDHNRYPPNKASEHSTEAGEWLWAFFRLYASESRHGGPVIRFFDTVARGLLAVKSKPAPLAHQRPQCILTIDTDGTVKQTDTFRVNGHRADHIGDRNIHQDSLVRIANSTENKSFIAKVSELSNKCMACRFLPVCGGGWLMHRQKSDSFRNPSIYCSDYIYLFEKIDQVLDQSSASGHV